MTDVDALLRRHRPHLRYDSQEIYFADSVATWTDNPGNELRRADGEVVATAGGDPALSLAFLGGAMYSDGTAVDPGDAIVAPATDLRRQAAALHLEPELRNRVYGRAAQDGAGRTWLQYWCFYFVNDVAMAGFGLHEGDWELVQLRLGADDVPDLAVYAQHDSAEQMLWPGVERAPDDHEAPVVYVARGSHASYFNAGPHWNGAWFDRTNGHRRSPRPAVLEDIGGEQPGWVHWPGRWGGTPAGEDRLHAPSPRGPVGHPHWDDPAALAELATAREASPLPPRPLEPPRPAALTVRRVGSGRLEIDYRFGAPSVSHQVPDRLVVTVNSSDDHFPPATETFDLDDERVGTVRPERTVVTEDRYDVNVSAAAADGVASGSVEVRLGRGIDHGIWPGGPFRA